MPHLRHRLPHLRVPKVGNFWQRYQVAAICYVLTMADVLVEDAPDLFQSGAPTPAIVDAIAHVPGVFKVKVIQKVQASTINDENKGARMKVGARVKVMSKITKSLAQLSEYK